MLSSFRVLDLTWVLGGPFAGQLLAQLGAEVIKVEPLEGDMARQLSRRGAEFQGDSAFFLSVNRGKESLALDLKSPAGREVFYDLVRQSDAVIYGFAPSVPERLGLDRDALLAVHPRLAIAQLIGLHDRPPYSEAPAFDLVVQAMAGIMSITGEREGAPVRVGYQIADLAGGLYLSLACVAAMLRALKTGTGELVQVSLLDCQLALLTWQAQDYFVSGQVPRANGARHPTIAPSDIYRCLDDRFVAISPTGQQFWQGFCKAMGRAELVDDPRFQTPKLRVDNADALTHILQQEFGKRTSTEWSKDLFEARVPAGPVNDVAQAVSQPLAGLRGMVEDVPHPATGATLKFLGSPFKFAGGASLAYPPRLGQHTRDVLTRVCGYDDTTIDALVRDRVVRDGRPMPGSSPDPSPTTD
ncbi:CoA transferase [Ramlibacter sp. AW1]|uniref:CoA transferase n=1 Tax=Ramlibacter aurantiacus TaxID=2801330 RepID=A0A936ZS71_9BURK|nr:CoA transferase [Ramlibacter aurantiacus]MBL0422665.1 CoA transferase [Ramlibacter aurantiacus]